MLIDIVQTLGISPKRVASTNGGEYASVCPSCGGTDRFRMWPATGRWWCRQCDQSGDEISFLREFCDMSYADACAYLGKSGSINNNFHSTPPIRQNKSASPPSQWKIQAAAFVSKCHEALMQNSSAINWLNEKRGLTESTIKTMRLGLNDKGHQEPGERWGVPEREKGVYLPQGLVIPVFRNGEVIRIKTRSSQRKPKYLQVAGGENVPLVLPGNCEKHYCIVVEAELDAILLHQEAGDLVTAIGLGSVSVKPDVYTQALLERVKVILLAFDHDKAGANATPTWFDMNYPNCQRWIAPNGKDVTEAFLQGTNLRAWVQAGMQEYGGVTTEVCELFDYWSLEMTPFPDHILDEYSEEDIERLAIQSIDGNNKSIMEGERV